MATLGDIMAAAKHSAAGFQSWLEAADPEFAEAVRLAAECSDSSPASYARIAVADFSRFADEDAWTRLIGIVRNCEDPGIACLTAMVRWRLAAGDRCVERRSVTDHMSRIRS